jgi:hypothetical protein
LDAGAKFGHNLAIDFDAAAGDQFFALPAAAEPGGGQNLLQALAGRMFADRGGSAWPRSRSLRAGPRLARVAGARSTGSSRPAFARHILARPLRARFILARSVLARPLGLALSRRRRGVTLHADHSPGALLLAAFALLAALTLRAVGAVMPFGGMWRFLCGKWSSFRAGHRFKGFVAKP